MEYLKKIGQKFGYSIFVQMSQTVCQNVILSCHFITSCYHVKANIGERSGMGGKVRRKATEQRKNGKRANAKREVR